MMFITVSLVEIAVLKIILFDGFAFNRLIDIMLEKNEKSEASELVDRFMKSEHACHSIRLNKLKLEIDNFEVRKSISTLCNEMIRDEIII